MDGTNSFYPPSKIISFNETTYSNGWIVVSLHDRLPKRCPHEDMQKQIAASILKWKKALKEGIV